MTNKIPQEIEEKDCRSKLFLSEKHTKDIGECNSPPSLHNKIPQEIRDEVSQMTKTPQQIRNEEPTGYRRGFIDGHKEAEKSIKEMIEKVLSILKEGCGVNFVLEEQDCICGDDFEYEDKVKVLLCELCLDKIKRIELLSKIGDGSEVEK